jgi:hypothetical protein
MQIVIDIPEEYYNFIKNHQYMDRYYSISEASKIFCAIKNGTPLPKGHGRLVDMSEVLIKLMQFYDGDKTIGQCLDEVNTIIEADKGRK